MKRNSARKRGRPPLSAAVRRTRERLLIKCRKQGLTAKEIAQETSLKQGVVSKIVSVLIARGALPKYPPRRSAPYHNPDHPRFQTIVEMVQRHATLEEIGAALDLTRERARQLIAKMRKEHGDQIFEPQKKTLWTPKEAAAEVDAPTDVVRRLCCAGEIPFLPRGERERLLDASGLAALRQHPSITGKRTCEICGATFIVPKKSSGRRKICYSDACARERNRRRNKSRYLLQQPTKPELLRGWRRTLLERLKNHTIGNTEQWLSNADACRRAHISNMQLSWLRYSCILTTRPHPTEKSRRTGQPITLFARSELDIVRQVYEAHRARGGK